MNQDPNQNPTNPNPDSNGGGTPPEQPQISLEDMLAGIGQQLGGSPADNEQFADATPAEKAILEEQYANKVERTFDKMQKEVKSKIEDATEGQVHEIGMAFMKGDIGAGIDAIQQALRQADEVDQNTKHLSLIHISEPTRPY